MLLLFAIFLVSSVIALIVYIVRREVVKSLPEQTYRRELPQPQYRSLFEPDEDDVRAAELIAAVREEEEKRNQLLKLKEEKLASLEDSRKAWAASANRTNTAELLYEAAQAGDGEAFLKTCEEVAGEWKKGRVAELSSDDLVRLVESHFWLLPGGERTPGVSFRLNAEIAGLRREFEKEN